MRVEALVATMNQTDDSILGHMNIQSDAVVINQCERFELHEYEKDGHCVCFYSLPERGVGLSRNTALMRGRGDICLFSDDDLVYRDGYEEMLLCAFQECPEADVIVFNISSVGDLKKRWQIKKRCRVRWFNYMRYGAARIAVRRESIQKKNICFSLLFGGGAQYSSGEDTIFLHDCLKAGLRIYAMPITLAETDDSSSTWFQGYDEKFLKDRGALYEAIYGCGAAIQAVIYLIRHKEVWENSGSIGKAFLVMRKGMQEYRQMQR